MADILNLPNCGGSTSTFNSGFSLCDVIRKAPKALLLLDAGVTYNTAERASIAVFVAAVIADTRAARGARVYPIMSLTNFEDVSKESTKAPVGNLSISEITMQESVPAFNFQHFKGDLFHKQLAKAEGGGYEIMIIDDAYRLYGTQSGADLKGFAISEFRAQLAKFATASEPAKYPFSVVLNSITEYKENLGIVQLDSTIMNIKGNVDVDLNTLGAPPVQLVNVAKISPIGRGGKNIGLLYPTELALVSSWTVTNVQTGVVTAPTSVAWDATLLRFNVTTDSTAYTALTTGQKLSVNLASPAVLATNGVDGFESLGPVTMIKP